MKFTRDIDKIRVRRRTERRTEPAAHICAWDNCQDPAPHRAPKSPERLREYFWFCAEHVREYNRSWNFFSGMSDGEVEHYIKDNLTGHRPTWKARMGNPSVNHTSADARNWDMRSADKFNLFGDSSKSASAHSAVPPGRKWPPLICEAFCVMDLSETATLKEIKVRYKELVKRFHPDAHGGDRATEGQLKQVIQAYNRLKACGIK